MKVVFIKRKSNYWMLITLVILILLVVTACGSNASNSKPGEGEEKTEKVTLTIAARAGAMGDALTEVAKKYEEIKGVNVQVVSMPYDELKETVVLDVRNKAGAYDLTMLDDPWMPEFAQGQLLANLDEYFKDGIDDDFIEKCVALGKEPYGEGSLYSFPMIGNVTLFYYRNDLLEKYEQSPPKTWDDVLRIAEIITKEEPDTYGYVVRGQRGNPIVSDYLPIFWAYGGEVLDKNMEPHVNSEAGVKAMETYLKLKEFSPKGAETFDSDQIATALTQGQIAMTIAWPSWVSQVDNPESSKVVGKIEFSSVPGQVKESAAMIGNWLLGVPKTSKNIEQAVDFLKWVTSKETQKEMALMGGGAPTRKSLYHDSDLTKLYRHYPAQLDALEHSVARPRTPYWSQIEDTWGLFLSQILAGQINIKEGLDKANEEINRILK